MRDDQKDVADFHNKFGVKIGDFTKPQFDKVDFRLALVQEEFDELKQALDEGYFLDAIDAICDLKYVLNGMALAFGVDLELYEEAVHEANMKKEGGSRREDGKILKPEGWKPPALIDACYKTVAVYEDVKRAKKLADETSD